MTANQLISTQVLPQLQDVAKEWYRYSHPRSRGVPPAFFEFIVCWISFNALYDSFSNDRSERERVRFFGTLQEIQQLHESLLQRPDYAHAVDYLSKCPIRNLQRNQAVVDIPNPSDCPRVLDAVYQIRCNLFHGDKSAYDPRDQRVVDAGATIVGLLLHHCLLC